MQSLDRGGTVTGPPHSEGGVKFILPGGRMIEEEGREINIPREIAESDQVFTFYGTNKQVLNEILSLAGLSISHKVTDVRWGDIVICVRSAEDETKHKFIGTIEQILNQINTSKGCRPIMADVRGQKADVEQPIIAKKGMKLPPKGIIPRKKDLEAENPNSPRWQKKKAKIEELSNNIHRLRLNASRDIQSHDEKLALTALVVAVMDKTAERIGNDDSADDGHFGVTGFRKYHIDVIGSKVHLNYVGKSGMKHEKSFSDERIAKALKKAIKNTPIWQRFVFQTSDGFRIKADKVNRYLQQFKISAKDMRGYLANRWMIEKLKWASRTSAPGNAAMPEALEGKAKKERKRIFNKALKQTAGEVGHGTGTLKKHYLIPELQSHYVENGNIIDMKNLGYFADGSKIEMDKPDSVINRLLSENSEEILALDFDDSEMLWGEESNRRFYIKRISQDKFIIEESGSLGKKYPEILILKKQLMTDGSKITNSNTMKKITVNYFFNHPRMGFSNSITVDALNNEDAIAKAKKAVLETYGSGMMKRFSFSANTDKMDKGGKISYPTERLPVNEQSIEERELELFIDNDGDLYRQRTVPIHKNLVTKIARGDFDINKAPLIYKYLIDDGIRKYNKDFGGMELSKPERDNLAKQYVNRFLDEAQYGNYENYLPKKYQMQEGGKIPFTKTINLGKVDYDGRGRKINAVDIKVELRNKEKAKNWETLKEVQNVPELSMTGNIWNGRHSDIISGGQNLEEIGKLFSGNKDLKRLIEIWREYHSNDLKAGTKKQSEAIEKWEAEGNKYDYDKAIEHLKSIGLYEDNGYKYGHGWLYQPIPESVIKEVQSLSEKLSAGKMEEGAVISDESETESCGCFRTFLIEQNPELCERLVNENVNEVPELRSEMDEAYQMWKGGRMDDGGISGMDRNDTIRLLAEILKEQGYEKEQADTIVAQVKDGDYAFVVINGRRLGLTTRKAFEKMNITKDQFIQLTKIAKGFGGAKIIAFI